MKLIRPILMLALLTLVAGAAAAEGYASSAEEIQPLLIGAKVPDVTLHTVDGKAVTLHQAVAEKPALVVFYRGGW